jgi:hypothetical protein
MSCSRLICFERGPHQHPACEACGAVAFGNIGCIACLRMLKRLRRGNGAFLRVLIKIRQRYPQL